MSQVIACQKPLPALWWEDRTVRERSHGSKRMRHPVGGELALCYDQLAATDGSDQRLMVLTPADGATERALRLLIAGYSQGAVGTSAQVLEAARTARVAGPSGRVPPGCWFGL
ncbi:hypothetical protein [Kitasatospora sp. NPDC005748]|uniref:MmyB family transcriptional regulator n=1 Tax=Kitasatospora sp. NPDC005748 TaxID=3157063 RepID=UPI0033E15B33